MEDVIQSLNPVKDGSLLSGLRVVDGFIEVRYSTPVADASGAICGFNEGPWERATKLQEVSS